MKPSRIRRQLEAAAFVAVWMALGWALRLDSNAYLLLGIPLTVAFQLLVRKEPLLGMWVREAPAFAPPPAAWVLLGLAAIPIYRMLRVPAATASWSVLVWHVAAIAGALGVVYCVGLGNRATWRELARCLGTAGAIGVVLVVLARAARGGAWELSPDVLGKGVLWLLLYIPIAFALEEVTFRGVLDAHVYRPGDRDGRASAVFIGALWGIWHLPVSAAAGASPVGQVVGLMTVHTLIGVPLAWGWRRSGNLAVPAITHAVINAVRNALLY